VSVCEAGSAVQPRGGEGPRRPTKGWLRGLHPGFNLRRAGG